MSPSSRMRTWGAGVATAHLVLGLLGWILLGVAPWFFGGCAAVSLAVALVAAPLMGRPPDDGPGGPGRGGGEPDDPEPPWWPGFERDFRAYDRARRTSPV